MTKHERFVKVYKWLYYKGIGNTQQEIAKVLGIDNSTLSQYLSGKFPITNKIVRTLCLCDNNINENWVIEGEGNMFIDSSLENVPASEVSKGNTDIADKLLHLIERSEQRIDETNQMIHTLAETVNKVTNSYDQHISELVKNRELVQAENMKLITMLEHNQHILEIICSNTFHYVKPEGLEDIKKKK